MKKKQILPVLIIVGLIVLVLLFIVGSKLIEKYTPTKAVRKGCNVYLIYARRYKFILEETEHEEQTFSESLVLYTFCNDAVVCFWRNGSGIF